MDFIDQLRELDLDTLTQFVRQAQQDEALDICDWQVAPLDYAIAMPTTGGLYRLAGTAQSRGAVSDWSMICKILVKNADSPTDPYYWKREALVYQSGLFGDWQGAFRLPRCYGVSEYPETAWLWLEEIVADANEWSFDHYRLAARSLGQFNGSYVNHPILTTCLWLSQHWLPRRLQEFAGVAATLHDLERGQHPLTQHAFAILPVNRLLQLHRQRATYLDALQALPPTLCHRDFTRDNVIFGRNADDSKHPVVIDWGFVGKGALGEDLGHFLAAALFGFQCNLAEASRFEELLWASYLAGCADAGWHGDPQAVRAGALVSAALAWSGLWLEWLPYLLRPDLQEWFEDKYHHPLATIAEQWSGALVFLLDQLEKSEVNAP